MRRRIIEAGQVSKGGRISRLIRNPIATLTPYVMRSIGVRRNVTVTTAWGGKFSGLLPEAVSSEIWRSGGFELPVSLALLQFLKPGGIYVDVGAHFGYFSLLASRLVGANGRVISVEAMPSTFSYLTNNIERNATDKNVTAFQNAGYSENIDLEFRDFGVVASSLNSAFQARDSYGIIKTEGKVVVVKARKVDDIVEEVGLQKIDLVKIDAESSEKFVLIGMSNILKKHRPAVVMEVGDSDPNKNSVKELVELLATHNYRPFSWDHNYQLQPFELIGHVPYANLVFCPIDSKR